MFILSEKTKHPFFNWPKTLISYDFVDDTGDALVDNNGIEVNYQLNDGKLYLITDLKNSEEKTFTFSKNKKSVFIKRNYYSEKDGFILVDNGKFIVRIPKTMQLVGAYAPAPVESVFVFGRKIGKNLVNCCDVTEVINIPLIQGDLFAKYEISYFVKEKCCYKVVVTIVYGYDFVEFDEEMVDLTEDAYLLISLENIEFDKYYAGVWPDPFWEPKTEKYGDYEYRNVGEKYFFPYSSEDPEWTLNVPKEKNVMQTRLGPYVPFFAYNVRPYMSFWNKSGESIGFFVTKHENWDEGDFPVWGTGNRLDGKVYWEAGKLDMRLALQGKKRSFAISMYNREMDEKWYTDLQHMAEEAVLRTDISYETARGLTCFPTSYTGYLHNYYVTLNLDKVKNWDLSYNYKLPQLPIEKRKSLCKSVDELKKLVYTTGRVGLATRGVEEFDEKYRGFTFDAVEIRMFLNGLADGYLLYSDELSEREYQSITAIILMSIYVAASEESIPQRKMLGGHPNFLADMKSVAGLGAAIFPQHSDARYFADVFEDYVKQNTSAHIRPTVEKYNSRGGRWTESIGIYAWAFLTPTLTTNELIKLSYDGKERVGCLEGIHAFARWIINICTPPVDGLRRMPAHGAHSELRPPFRVIELLAKSIKEFDADLASQLMFISYEDADFVEKKYDNGYVWDFLYKDEAIKKQSPDFVSCKYTGYGCILRQNTVQESAVYLLQIDRGPNYRWGLSSQGGCGVLYYFTHGKAWSMNGKEDVGDRSTEDTTYASNFGVWKNGTFKSIGMNELSSPLYDLDYLQYAKILADKKYAYSYPEYIFRSVLMTPDYIVIYDGVGHSGVITRFSWYVRKEDSFPYLHFIKGVTLDKYGIKDFAYSTHNTAQTKGKWFEGTGDCMCVVSPRQMDVENHTWGCKINEDEYVFMSQEIQRVSVGTYDFTGKVGYAKANMIAIIEAGRMEYFGVEITINDGSIRCEISEIEIVGTISTEGGMSLEIKGRFNWHERISKGKYRFRLNNKMDLILIEDDYMVVKNENYKRRTVFLNDVDETY